MSSSSKLVERQEKLASLEARLTWLAMFDDVLLAQSAVDRFRNSAYDFVVDGESYRPKLKPRIEDEAPPPTTPAMKPPALQRRAKRRR